MKKLILFLMCTLLLTGCANDSTTTVVEFSTWGSASEIAIIKNVINEYEKISPNLKIRLHHIPQNYFKKLHLMLASGTEPDVMLINNQNLNAYSGYFETIDKNKYDKLFYPNAIKSLSVLGELKAVPRDVSTLVLYYNKSLLRKYGIQEPRCNWTYEDFLSVAAKLKKHSIYALPLENDIFYLYPFIMSNGEDVENLSSDNIEDYKSFKTFKELSLRHHYAPLDFELGALTGAEFFLAKKSAFYISGRWMTPKIREVADFDWDIINFPMGKMGSLVPCDSTGWAVSKRSSVKNEAIAFVEYLASDKALREMAKSGLIVPARISASYSPEFLSSPPKSAWLFLDLAKRSKVVNYPKNYNKERDLINEKIKNSK